jgi:hypothetical protein
MILGQEDFPFQKKTEREKTKDWAEKCVRAASDMGLYAGSFRDDYYEIRTNMDLYNNILNKDDMISMCDPFGVNNNDFPFEPQHYPVANSKINLLLGEEIKRKFDWKVRVINQNAVTEKEKQIKEMINEQFLEMIMSKTPQDQMAEKIQELDNYLRYDYQDLREKRATDLLNHIMEKENLKYKWNMGFLDGLVAGREIYSLDIVNGEPRVRKCNPANVRIIRKGQSPDVQDADIILEWGYHSKGNVIDDYPDYLTSDEVSEIERMGVTMSTSADEAIAQGREPDLIAGTFSMIQDANGNLTPSTISADTLLSPISHDGAILVTRVVWRSYRKIGKLKYYDRKTGEQLYRFVDEFYKPRVERGEEVEKYIWVTDWWEGTRIGESIFVKMRPFPVKAYGINNPTGTLCPYVGGDYTQEGEPTTSLMGRMKPYSYYYDFLMFKQWETLSKHKGVVGYLDLAMIPEGWEMEDALYFADKMGWLPIDSFKEARKGAATGTIAGNMNANRSPMNFDMGNYLQQNMYILNFIKEEIANISGVSRQREGAISSSELVGNTQRSVMQSSHITELYFQFHDRIKIATLKAALEVAKHAYRGRKLNIQYITDDMSQILSEIDGNAIREIDYGITINSSLEYSQLQQMLLQLAQAGLQNDKVNFSQIMDIMTDPSISSVRRKIETAERAKIQETQQQMQQQQELQAQQQQAMQQIEQMKQEGNKQAEQFKADMQMQLEKVRNDGKIELERVKAELQRDLKMTESSDTLIKTKTDVEKLAKELQHEAQQKELDRESKEEIEKMKSKKSIK